MQQIALIDNYPIARAGFSLLLKDHLPAGFKVDSFQDVQQLESSHLKFAPDIILLALNQSGRSKEYIEIAACRRLFSKARIMVYGDRFNYDDLVELIQMGVRGFMLKSCDIPQFVSGIHEIMSRQHFFCGELLAVILSKLSLGEMGEIPAIPHALSAREREVANYLVKGLKTSDIAQRLGRKMTTISTIKGNVFRKLNVRNVMELNERMHLIDA